MSSIKFDSRTNTPYGGFIRSVSQILQQILSEPEEETKLFSEYFISSLGAQSCNIHLLINLIPELRSLLYPDDVKKSNVKEGVDDDGQADSVETRVRFQNLFVEVIRSISNWHLLTLVSFLLCDYQCQVMYIIHLTRLYDRFDTYSFSMTCILQVNLCGRRLISWIV